MWLILVGAAFVAAIAGDAGARTADAARAPCSPPRTHAAGDFTETITSGAMQRTYILHVPASYTGAKATPLLFNFHGYGSSAVAQAVYSGLPQKSDEAGFITGAILPIDGGYLVA